MGKHSWTLAVALEAVGIASLTGGIVIEAVTGADIGYIIITSSSLLIAAGSLLYAKVIRRKE